MSDLIKSVAAQTHGSAFDNHMGWECVEVREDQAVFEMPFQEHFATVGDRVHGGAIAALADAAATTACWASSKLPENPLGATIGFSINYLNAALGKNLRATANVVRRGGSICVADVWIRDEGGEDIARATFTYKISGKPSAS